MQSMQTGPPGDWSHSDTDTEIEKVSVWTPEILSTANPEQKPSVASTIGDVPQIVVGDAHEVLQDQNASTIFVHRAGLSSTKALSSTTDAPQNQGLRNKSVQVVGDGFASSTLSPWTDQNAFVPGKSMTLAQVSQYRYSSLATGEFRAVEFSISSSDTIECSIVHYPLGEGGQCLWAYEALSYTWGDHEKTETIKVNGQDLPVTWSLYYALYHLRWRHQRLWVDAICINQDDPTERGLQVQEMSKIYARASNVIVWLGPATPDSNALMYSLVRLQLSCDGTDRDVTDPYWKVLWDHQNPSNLPALKFGLKDILARSWFTRVWIIQEVAFANWLVVYCGSLCIVGKTLALAPSLLMVEPGKQRQAILDIMASGSRHSSWWRQPRDLLSLPRRFYRCQSSEARDRVYALIGLCSDQDVIDHLQPDYLSPDVDVVHRVLFHLFGLTKANEDILMKYPTISRLLQDMDELERISLTRYEQESESHTPQTGVAGLFQLAAKEEQGGFQAMRFFLRSYRTSSFPIPKDAILSAVSNPHEGGRMIDLLLEYRGREIRITSDIVCAAARNEVRGLEILQILLARRFEEVRLTANIMRAAADNSAQGKAILRLLLEKCGSFCRFTEEITKMTLLSFDEEIVTLLYREGGLRIRITDNVIAAGCRDHETALRVVQLICLRHDNHSILKDETVGAVFRYLDYRSAARLLVRLGSKVEITEGHITAIIDNLYPKERALGFLQWWKQSGVLLDSKITDSVFAFVIVHSDKVELTALLKAWGDRVRITRPFLEAFFKVDAPGPWEDIEAGLRYTIRKSRSKVGFAQDEVLELQSGSYGGTWEGQEILRYMQWSLEVHGEWLDQDRRSVSRMSRLFIRHPS